MSTPGEKNTGHDLSFKVMGILCVCVGGVKPVIRQQRNHVGVTEAYFTQWDDG